MLKLSSVEKFELGTIFAFFSLAFYTLVPYLFFINFIFVSSAYYKVLATFFLLISLIFYLGCQELLNKQIRVFGVIFILFGGFQIFSDNSNFSLNILKDSLPILIGLVLIIISFRFKKNNEN